MERIIRLIQWGILEQVQLLLELTCLIAIAYDISSLKNLKMLQWEYCFNM